MYKSYNKNVSANRSHKKNIQKFVPLGFERLFILQSVNIKFVVIFSFSKPDSSKAKIFRILVASAIL